MDKEELQAISQMIAEHDTDHPGEKNTWNVLKRKLIQVLHLADAVVDSMHEDTKFTDADSQPAAQPAPQAESATQT